MTKSERFDYIFRLLDSAGAFADNANERLQVMRRNQTTQQTLSHSPAANQWYFFSYFFSIAERAGGAMV